jgi:hypothetical protein
MTAKTESAANVVLDVSRPVIAWRWRSILLAPIQLLALAWGIPLLVLLLMVPVGLAVAGALWVGRLVVSP